MRSSGSIINTSSNVGLSGDKSRTAYGVTKGAINTLTKYIASQYGKQGIRCHAGNSGFGVPLCRFHKTNNA